MTAHVEIFTGPNCSQCATAKALLRERGIAFVEHDVSRSEAGDAFRQRLPRARAIPQLFVDGEHLGGLEDLQMALQQGRLVG